MRLARVVLFVPLAGCFVGGQSKSFEIGEPVDRVEVFLGSGDVDVFPSDGDRVSVDYDMGGVSGSLPGHRIEDGVLILDLRCDGACGGDVMVDVPHGVDVDVELERGDVLLSDLSGDVRVQVGAGEVHGGVFTGDDIAVAVGAGNVSLDVDARPVDIWVDVGAGDLYLGVPPGGYVMDIGVGTGELWLDGVVEDTDAESRLHARTGAGAVLISEI